MVRAPLLLLVVVAATVDITAHARRLGEADATAWQIHSGSTNVVANEDGADHAECPVTCVAMRKKNDGSGFERVQPGEKRIDAVHVEHASSAGAPCEATGLAHLYSHLTVRAYGWHRHSSGCKKPPAKKFRKHTCLHNIDTGTCSCKCNYKPEEAV